MLVLTRDVNEIIQIGPDVRILVVSVGRGKVRLGIDAPRETTVLRGELLTSEDRAKYAELRGGAA